MRKVAKEMEKNLVSKRKAQDARVISEVKKDEN